MDEMNQQDELFKQLMTYLKPQQSGFFDLLTKTPTGVSFLAGQGLGLAGSLIQGIFGAGQGRAKRAEANLNKRTKDLEGMIGTDVFNPYDVSNFALKEVARRAEKDAQGLQDITGNINSADARGALLEQSYGDYMGVLGDAKKTNALAKADRDYNIRSQLFNNAMQQYLNT